MRPFKHRPTLIGHRGSGRGPGRPPENTVESLLAAVRAGADWVELDVRRTRDDALVLMHHATVPGSDEFAVDLSADQVAAHGVEFLADALAALPEGVGVDVDVKTSLEDALLPAASTTTGLLVDLLRASTVARPVMVTSFDPGALVLVRDAVPGVSAGLLTWKNFPLRKAIPAAAHLGLDAVVAHVSSFGPNEGDPAPVHRSARHTTDIAHRAGLDVVAWCPGPADAVRLVEAGVDALVVDDLTAVRAALESAGPDDALRG